MLLYSLQLEVSHLADLLNFFLSWLTFGSIVYQTYAPTTLAAARDFWTLRYTTSLEDGSLVVSYICSL